MCTGYRVEFYRQHTQQAEFSNEIWLSRRQWQQWDGSCAYWRCCIVGGCMCVHVCVLLHSVHMYRMRQLYMLRLGACGCSSPGDHNTTLHMKLSGCGSQILFETCARAYLREVVCAQQIGQKHGLLRLCVVLQSEGLLCRHVRLLLLGGCCHCMPLLGPVLRDDLGVSAYLEGRVSICAASGCINVELSS